jgi:BirA family biotin operon repressor/biotin-[acetyl-CoA-carboxylase] ligase
MIVFTEERLRDALWPRPFQYFPQVGSTNDLAAAWAQEGAPHGALVITDEQLNGRGRFNRMWHAPSGTALLMSVILRPQLPATHLSQLTMIGAVALTDVIEAWCPGKASIKWPNDIQAEGRKLAGVLVESSWQNQRLEYVIMGIGLNVRIDFAKTPLSDSAISLSNLTDQPIDRTHLLAHLLKKIDEWSLHLQTEALWTTWRARLNMLGKPVTVTLPEGQVIVGQAEDVSPQGALQLIDTAGDRHSFVAGDVSLRVTSDST